MGVDELETMRSRAVARRRLFVLPTFETLMTAVK